MITIDFRDLNLIITVYDSNSISEASRKLFISQPAITYRIRNIEKELGIKILTRHSTGVSFTDQGMYFLEYCKKAIKDFENLKASVKNVSNNINGRINIFVSTVFAKYYLATILKNFKKEFTNIEFVIKTFSSCILKNELIKNQTADIIIRRSDIANENDIVLFEEPYGITTKVPLNFNQLKSSTWIKYDLPFKDEIFLDWCKEVLKINKFDKIIQVNSIEASLDLISQGFGWTMLPKIHLNNFKSLYFYPITNKSGKTIKLKNLLIYDKKTKNPAVKIFIEYISRNIVGNYETKSTTKR